MKNKQHARRVLTVGFHLAVETKGRGPPKRKSCKRACGENRKENSDNLLRRQSRRLGNQIGGALDLKGLKRCRSDMMLLGLNKKVTFSKHYGNIKSFYEYLMDSL